MTSEFKSDSPQKADNNSGPWDESTYKNKTCIIDLLQIRSNHNTESCIVIY